MSAVEASGVAKPGVVFYLGRGVLRPLFRFVYGLQMSGRENVPRSGAVLLAANHLSGWDTVMIPVASPRPVQFLTKSSLFTAPGVRGKFQRWFFTSIGAIAVHRAAGHAAHDALGAGAGVLRAGSVFAVFPEGTRSRDGRLYRGRAGAAFLALETGATVVPVGLTGMHELTPFGWLRGRPRPTVTFGAPIAMHELSNKPRGIARKELTEQIMNSIAVITGQERADELNATSSDSGV